MLKRISDKEIEAIIPRYAYLKTMRDKIHFTDGILAGVNAQLEKSQKEHDAIVREIFREIDDFIIGTTASFEKRMTEGCVVLDVNLPQWQAHRERYMK